METTHNSSATRVLIGVVLTFIGTTVLFFAATSLGAGAGFMIDTSMSPDQDWAGLFGFFVGALAGAVLGAAASIVLTVKLGSKTDLAASVITVVALPALYLVAPLVG